MVNFRRTFGALLLCSLLACLKPAGVRYPSLPTHGDGALHIINFDVGQGDALLVLYKGKSLLFDCGSPNNDPRRASQRIPRRLDALLGSRHIDYFVISHYHQDHLGSPGRQRNKRVPSGIYSLLERDGVTVGTVLDRGFWTADKRKGGTQKHYERAIQKWLARGVVSQRRQVRPGERIDLGEGLDIEVIAASANGVLDKMAALFPTFVGDSPPSENDYSVGLKFTFGDFEMFAAGDLSGANAVRRFGPVSQSYSDIESHIAKRVGAVEVYRVNHHGSRHSSNPCFAQVLHPDVSVFSTGVNTYGHPAPEVYERLREYGDVYITGGVAKEHRAVMGASVVGDDVEILVAPQADAYWLNGIAYRTRNDAEEAKRPKAREHCDAGEQRTPESYTLIDDSGSKPGD